MWGGGGGGGGVGGWGGLSGGLCVSVGGVEVGGRGRCPAGAGCGRGPAVLSVETWCEERSVMKVGIQDILVWKGRGIGLASGLQGS